MRSLDALHLAAAVLLPPADLVVATWDRRLHAAALAVGLRVLPGGAAAARLNAIGAHQVMRYGEAMPSRARSDDPRTTLRLPRSLADIADRLAKQLEVSRNDALLRLAARGAQQFEQEQRIAELRERRWNAIVPGRADADQGAFPSPEEAKQAVRGGRDDLAESAS